MKWKKGNPTAGVKAVVQRAQGIESGRGGSQSRGHGAKGKSNVAKRRGKSQKYITPAPVRMPLCKGHKIHDSIADIKTRKPQRQLRCALGQLRSPSGRQAGMATDITERTQERSTYMEHRRAVAYKDRQQSVQGPSNRHPAALPDHPRHMGGISAAGHKLTGAERQSGANADDPATGPGERRGERSITEGG